MLKHVSRVLFLALIIAGLGAGLPSAGAVLPAGEPIDPGMNSHVRGTGLLPNFSAPGTNMVRLLAGAFDPLAGLPPAVTGVALVPEATLPAGQPQYWLVQVNEQRFPEATAAVEVAGGHVVGVVPDDTYMVKATPEQRLQIAASPAVRWTGYYQPSWRIAPAVNGFPGLLDLAGPQVYRIYLFDGESSADATAALGAIPGVAVIDDWGAVIDAGATAAQLPAIAALPQVEWVSVKPQAFPLNADARWVTDTGVRDLLNATAPGRLTGAGQTAAVADTGVNYTYDLNGRAHVAFRDCDAAGVCKEAIYTQTNPGTDDLLTITDNDTDHRKMVAYFDLGQTGPNMFDESSHGSHTSGSVGGDAGVPGVADGEDGMAPAAGHVHQNIATASGGLTTPGDIYELFRQAYRPRNPGSVANSSPAGGNAVDFSASCADPAAGASACYRPLEDARTHNDSWGIGIPIIDLGDSVSVDKFVWDHEDMVIVFSAGNGGPGAGTISAPSVAKNDFSSGASANGRQPMVSIDSMASFSSHGPTGDGRIGVDLATPGQIVVSVKGGSEDGYHVAQGTSMSAPILTGLSTLVRQYFFDGYADLNGSGFAIGEPTAGAGDNPSAALIKATMANGAVRMRGFYTGVEGTRRDLDGQWPSGGQGFGRVNLDNSLYFTNDPTTNWYHDVWRGDAEAFAVSGTPVTRTYNINVQSGAPFDVTMAWTDPPDQMPAGSPAVINNLDLVVTGPDGTTYIGNNMNSVTNPSVAVAETMAGNAPPDVRNPVERVSIANPAAGVYTVTVTAEPIAIGKQGFALAASGRISAEGQTFTPGPALQQDAAGAPAISAVNIDRPSADTAKVYFTTNEPTTATATLTVRGEPVTFTDTYNVGPAGFFGLNAGPVETSADYANKPVVSTSHEILLTGLDPGAQYSVTLAATDLSGMQAEQAATFTSPATIFQPDAPDIGQLVEATAGGWRTGTQMYAGDSAGDGLLGAFMFRIPAAAIDPTKIVGAAVELTTAHNWMVPYTDDPLLTVDLLNASVEPTWGTQTYEDIHGAAADARVYPETTFKRGAYQVYPFAVRCMDLQALKNTLSLVTGGQRQAAFRWEASGDVTDGLFSVEFGFNRRSTGPDTRPRLVLFTGDDPYGAPCNPAAPAPTISNVGVHDGATEDAVTVTWETNSPSDSMVVFREQGTDDWIQVGAPSSTKVHQVEVVGLDRSANYEFAVRSSACNGTSTTDTNGGEGYSFFYPHDQLVSYYFHGEPTDELNKQAGADTATFDQTAPDEEIGAIQQGTVGLFANPDFAGNPLAVFWRAPFSGEIDTDLNFEWYWSGGPSREVFGQELEVTVFADPDLSTGDGTIIGRGHVGFDGGQTPTLNTGFVHVAGTVQNELLIQVAPFFLAGGSESLLVHYDSIDTPSRFYWLAAPHYGALAGPVEPVSAGATNLNPPSARGGPATFTDIVHGTCSCIVKGQPDLRVTSSEITATTPKGSTTSTVSVLVHNDGSEPAANVPVRFQDNGLLIATQTVASIPAGGTATVTASWVTKGLKGTHTITVTVDPADVIAESNEANNTASRAFTIKGGRVQ